MIIKKSNNKWLYVNNEMINNSEYFKSLIHYNNGKDCYTINDLDFENIEKICKNNNIDTDEFKN